VVAYGVPLFGEALGWLTPQPVAGVAGPRATLMQALDVWVTSAFVLGAAAFLMQQLVRLLRDGAEWHQLLVERAPVMIAVLDDAGRVTAANPAAALGLGLRSGGRHGEPFLDRVAGDARDAVRAHLAAAAAGAEREFVARLVGGDGAERVVEVRAHPLPTGKAGPQVLVLLRDVTGERAAADALRRSEERFRALVQHASDVIVVIDAEWRYAYVSPSGAQLAGTPVEAIVGRPVVDDVHPDDLPSVTESLRAALAAPGVPVTLRYRLRTAGGTWRLIESVGTNLLAEPAVRGYVFNTRDVTERAELEAQLTHQAYHDALTGLANRARFAERMGAALERARLAGDPARVAVLVLDLDGFKTVNDSLGHAAGDRLLVEVSTRLLAATRGCDTVARLGGDEFGILLEGVRDDADTVTVAERVVEALRPAFEVHGRQAFVGTSVGIARAGARAPDADVDATTTDDIAGLLRDADAAMYEAKARGKGRWVRFEPAMHVAAVARLGLEADLRAALTRDEFEVHYQPIVELTTGRTVAAEALVRWRHPLRGLVPPLEFIPFCEETGLIVPLGATVLERACADAAGWQAHVAAAGDRAPFGVAVNVSSKQLLQPGFVDEVASVLARSGLVPTSLTLEITEYSVIEQPALVRERLTALRALGVCIAIDDFGTGYSALSHLQQFPIDVLKVDRAFVDRVTRGGPHAAVTRTLVALGAALGLRTVAEGSSTRRSAPTSRSSAARSARATCSRAPCPRRRSRRDSSPSAAPTSWASAPPSARRRASAPASPQPREAQRLGEAAHGDEQLGPRQPHALGLAERLQVARLLLGEQRVDAGAARAREGAGAHHALPVELERPVEAVARRVAGHARRVDEREGGAHTRRRGAAAKVDQQPLAAGERHRAARRCRSAGAGRERDGQRQPTDRDPRGAPLRHGPGPRGRPWRPPVRARPPSPPRRARPCSAGTAWP
jgi:diguanylate cyclase (GGDEF)-like protein/PAS domain S-box-containing protein